MSNEILRNKRSSLETKKKVLGCYVIPTCMTMNVGQFPQRRRQELKQQRCGFTEA